MATVTITTTAAEDTRIAAAMGSYLTLGRPATAAEVKAAITTWISTMVQSYETQANQTSFASSYTKVQPS